MKVLITAIVTVGIIALVSMFTLSDSEIVKLAIASVGSLATGIEIGKQMVKKE